MRKIIEVSNKLYLEQGVKKTTIRQIIEAAGIRNGTLYHYFKGKEDIFGYIVLDSFDQIFHQADNLLLDGDSPELRFSVEIALTIWAVETDRRIAELYNEAYHSWYVLQVMLPKASERLRDLFHVYNPGFSDMDYKTRALAILGCTCGFVSESFHEGKISHVLKTCILLEMMLASFNTPIDKRSSTIEKALSIIEGRI